ncbi:MAG: hypothetical protein JSW41_03915 [Candidatus Aenigmatarchaeota archaeon]|nr:MAG: hypothetical protein JSW41_03915 [Candidatus Aenigmarchaeota archaeon]
MVKEGYKAVSLREETWDKAKVLASQMNLGLGKSVGSVVDRAINLLVDRYRERFAKDEGKTFEESLIAYQKAKGQAPLDDFEE